MDFEEELPVEAAIELHMLLLIMLGDGFNHFCWEDLKILNRYLYKKVKFSVKKDERKLFHLT